MLNKGQKSISISVVVQVRVQLAPFSPKKTKLSCPLNPNDRSQSKEHFVKSGSSVPCPLIPLGFDTDFKVVFLDLSFPQYVLLPIPMWLGTGLTNLNADDPLDTVLAGDLGLGTCRNCLIGPECPELAFGAMKVGYFLAEGPGLQKSSSISSGVTSMVMQSSSYRFCRNYFHNFNLIFIIFNFHVSFLNILNLAFFKSSLSFLLLSSSLLSFPVCFFPSLSHTFFSFSFFFFFSFTCSCFF